MLVTQDIKYLRRDPYEKVADESGMYTKWMGKKMWTFGPAKNIVQQHLMTLKKYPPRGATMQNKAVIEQQTSHEQGLAQ